MKQRSVDYKASVRRFSEANRWEVNLRQGSIASKKVITTKVAMVLVPGSNGALPVSMGTCGGDPGWADGGGPGDAAGVEEHAEPVVVEVGEPAAGPVESKYLRCRLTGGVSGKRCHGRTRGRPLDETSILPSHRWSYPTHWRFRKSRSRHLTNKWTLRPPTQRRRHRRPHRCRRRQQRPCRRRLRQTGRRRAHPGLTVPATPNVTRLPGRAQPARRIMYRQRCRQQPSPQGHQSGDGQPS